MQRLDIGARSLCVSLPFLVMAASFVPAASTNSFVNFESPPVHPLALAPNGERLVLCNLPDARIEVFDLTSGIPRPAGSIPVGLDPVSVRFRTSNEVWVVNLISDSLNAVDLESKQVVATLPTADAPMDVVFAGNPPRAYVSCSGVNEVQVFDPIDRTLVQTLPLEGNRPRALAVSPDGRKVYVAFFESGNQTTILSGGVGPLATLPPPLALNFPQGPYGGMNPPPNAGNRFEPPLNALLPTNTPSPKTGLILRKGRNGKWLDDNQGDWTEFVSGSKAAFSGRPPGWDLIDHDVAEIDTETHQIKYVGGLMNICMDLAVNPITGAIAVVGTDAENHVRYEPNLKSVFVKVKIALTDPVGEESSVLDLNPHLDYRTTMVDSAIRGQSVGDPRSIVWTADGQRGFVAGMGSGNIISIDAAGRRSTSRPAVKVGDGPVGLALDEARQQLYAWERFAGTLTVVDLNRMARAATLNLFDPTPLEVKAGRRFLYDTHETSGLGQVSCGSCHVDGRFDRLAWDLGNPAGDILALDFTKHNFGQFTPNATNDFHPMKGPMVTQTLQDIIGHEPFHWRGDRGALEDFNPTFTALQGRSVELTTNEMGQLKAFLATLTFPPNPFRNRDNSLSTNLLLRGHLSLGRGDLEPGKQLPNGNAVAGMRTFRDTSDLGCVHCHTLPTGLGPDLSWNGFSWRPFPVGSRGEHHTGFTALNRSTDLPFKIPQLRSLHDKMGMDLLNARSLSGFGFFHDGGVDSLTRFVQDSFNFAGDQPTADILAFLLSISGSDLPPGLFSSTQLPPGVASRDVPASVGTQLTLTQSTMPELLNVMVRLSSSTSNRVDLIVRGAEGELRRGWVFDRKTQRFRTDQNGGSQSRTELLSLANPAHPLTWMLVPLGMGVRLGIDRDEDGYMDRTEIEFGSDPDDAESLATNRPPIFSPIPVQHLFLGDRFQTTIRATDSDRPKQTLRYRLEPPRLEGIVIDEVSGVLTWSPPSDFDPGDYSVGLSVIDDGNPPRQAIATFSLVLHRAEERPVLRSISFEESLPVIHWSGMAGKTYQIEFTTSLSFDTWQSLGGPLVGTGDIGRLADETPSRQTQRYYRILLKP